MIISLSKKKPRSACYEYLATTVGSVLSCSQILFFIYRIRKHLFVYIQFILPFCHTRASL